MRAKGTIAHHTVRWIGTTGRSGIMNFLLFVLLPFSLYGQSGLDVRLERPSRIVSEGGYTTYLIEAENRSTVPINLQVIRTVNRYPDDSWEISVCSPDLCYEAEVDTLDPYVIEPGEISGAQVHVLAGDTGSADVVISLDPQDGTEPVLVALHTEVGVLPAPSLFVRVDSTASTGGRGDTVEFGLFLLNTSGDSLRPRLVRLERDYPDGTWSDFLCRFDQCIPPDQNVVTASLQKNQGVVFSVKMIGGMKEGETGEVEVMIDPGDGTEPTFHRFSLTVDPLLSVAAENKSREFHPIPNPTVGGVRIECGGECDVSRLRIGLFDQGGRELTDRVEILRTSDAIFLSLSNLPRGTYHCTIDADGSRWNRTIVRY